MIEYTLGKHKVTVPSLPELMEELPALDMLDIIQEHGADFSNIDENAMLPVVIRAIRRHISDDILADVSMRDFNGLIEALQADDEDDEAGES